MSRFTCVESDRVLSLLSEAIEKLHLLATVPAPTLDVNSNHLAAVALKTVRSQLDGDAAFALDNHFLAEDDLLRRLTQPDRIELNSEADDAAFSLAKATTRALCRALYRHAQGASVLLAEHTSNKSNYNNQSTNNEPGLSALAGHVAAVRDRVRATLSTSVEEDDVHRALLSDMKVRIREAEHDYKQMLFEVRAQHEARDAASRQNLKKILALKTELHDINHGTEQANALIDQDAKQAEFGLLNAFEEDNARIRDEVSTRNVAQGQVQDQHHYVESGHRKKKLKGAVELGSLLERGHRCDAGCGASDAAEIDRLVEHFAVMDENDRRTAADLARWDDERKLRESKDAMAFRYIAKIQAHFRGYRTRMQLKAAHKKKKKKKTKIKQNATKGKR
ncbi:hypothetical protein SPRG_10924 [Saprolegnia parasitica CBS 223.65]|uniref:Dynein regulatory complex protein 10 n=1 Tax=Saprolegnia parasitica (strain CBS 223.65) TaxID=695850 RepID=A0A067C6D2_SAPPC|nr:hypothetical protein SPRG_10924 [Saprolegnia parasitica CBS 223.65]KDO22106.1 hypothetical protein SPRG_10924 [Saprolegnia parasitica CBS 223.65]|eukprot:XP_012207146.1 hypothetical protein SPRG_10924 [Saprolegnia parasitica CBS 223.65]